MEEDTTADALWARMLAESIVLMLAATSALHKEVLKQVIDLALLEVEKVVAVSGDKAALLLEIRSRAEQLLRNIELTAQARAGTGPQGGGA